MNSKHSSHQAKLEVIEMQKINIFLINTTNFAHTPEKEKKNPVKQTDTLKGRGQRARFESLRDSPWNVPLLDLQGRRISKK